jgi:Protein of unknown function (DUF664).
MSAEPPRSEPPLAGDEAATLLGFLEFHRETLAWKTSGLDAAGLARTLPPSTMTLGGMLKHLARVEDFWFGQVMLDREPTPPFDTAPWREDRDWDWRSAGADSPEELRALHARAVGRSREVTARLLAEDGLETLSRRTDHEGRRWSLRWVLVHMVEEYARHNGHADLLRESVDGLVGE